MNQSQKRKKQTFLLRNIDINEIDKKYNLNTPNDKNVLFDDIIPYKTDITKIDELTRKEHFVVSFIDNSKKHYITMVDCITQQTLKGSMCFWCRHSFSTLPIGCPLKYVSNKIIKVHTSKITKEVYSVHQPVPKCIDIQNEKNICNDYYETDGIFCSFNCCLAFINDNVSNPMYNLSKHLLMKMYIEVFSAKAPMKINPAPSWRLLRDYGGFMTIEEFRASFNNYMYIDCHHAIGELPKVKPIGYIFEEHYIF